MMWQLVRGNWRSPKVWVVPAVTAVGAFLEPVVLGIYSLFVIALMVPLLLSPAVSLFESALPIPTRTVIVSRWIAASALALPALLAALVATLVRQPWHIADPLSPLMLLAASALLIIVNGVVYLGAARPGTTRVGIVSRVLPIVAAGSVVLVLLPPMVAMTSLVVCALLLLAVVARRIPRVMEHAPRESAHSEPTALDREVTLKDATIWRMLLRSSLHHLLWFPALLGFLAGQSGDAGIHIQMIGLVCGIAVASRRFNTWLLRVPLPHRTRLLLSIGPTICIGFGAMALGASISQERVSSFLTNQGPTPRDDYDNETNVAITYWQQFNSDAQPRVIAPWGESVSADTLSLFGTRIFNPYTTDSASSERFVDWQFERAATAAYGQSMTRVQYRELLQQDSLPQKSVEKPRLFLTRTALLLALILAVLWFIELMRWNGFRQSKRVRNFTLGVLVVLYVLPSFLELYFHHKSHGGRLLLPLVDGAMLRISLWLPHATSLAVLVSLVPAVVLYFLLEWQFKKTDSAHELAYVARAS